MCSDADIMRSAWDARAETNPLYAIDAHRRTWELEEFYSQGPAIVNRIVDPALKILSVDPSGLRVLEVGCGMGRLFEGLSRRFAEVWGIDISREMLEKGEEHCPVEAKWLLGDGFSLREVESASIDHVISFEVFGHIPRLKIIRSYLGEFHRVIRPEGTFQAQLRRRSDSARQAIVRSLPRPGRIAIGGVLKRLGVVPAGDIDTWLGRLVAPNAALSMLRTIGFVDCKAVNADFSGPPVVSSGYWVIGRRPAE